MRTCIFPDPFVLVSVNYIPGIPFPIPCPFPVPLSVALPIPMLFPIPILLQTRSSIFFPFPNSRPLPFRVPIALLVRFPFPVIYPCRVPIPIAFPFYMSVRLMIIFMIRCVFTISFRSMFRIPYAIKMFLFPSPHRFPFLLPLTISPIPLSVSDFSSESVFDSVCGDVSVSGFSSDSISDSVSVSPCLS